MPRNRTDRLSVILDADQKARLEDLARRASYERHADITISDLVRDAIEAYLARTPQTRLRKIAEAKTDYRA